MKNKPEKDPCIFTWKEFKRYIENQGVRDSDKIESINFNGRDDTAPYIILPNEDSEVIIYS